MFTMPQLQSILSRNAKIITTLQGNAYSCREKARALKLERNVAESDDIANAMTTTINRFYRERRKQLVFASALSELQIEAKLSLKQLGQDSRTAVRKVKADTRAAPASFDISGGLLNVDEVSHHPA